MEISVLLVRSIQRRFGATVASMNEQEPPTVRAMTAELSAVIRAGAVHMFKDEADTLARQCVVAIREKWPAIFRRQPKWRKSA